jgi:hypothetical protein
MMIVFPTAKDARDGSRNNLKIYDEIRFIEQAILAAIGEGLLIVQIKTSPMTNVETGIPYYATLFEDANDRSLAEQMNIVEKNFVDLGYTVVRKQNTVTGNTFYWEILW